MAQSTPHTLLTTRATSVMLGLASTTLVACGGSSGTQNNTSNPTQTGSHSDSTQLVRTQSDKELLEHLANGLLNLSIRDASITTDRPSAGQDLQNSQEDAISTTDSGAAPAPSADDGGFSGTNVVELGVDEADVSKFDGEYLFLTKQPDIVWGWAGPLPVEPGVVDIAVPEPAVRDEDGATDSSIVAGDDIGIIAPPNPESISHASVHVFRTDQASASATPVTQLELASRGLSIDGLYLHGARTQGTASLISVSSSYQYGWGYWEYEPAWQNGKTQVDIWNVNDVANITNTVSLEWQGYHVSSRRIGDTLYVVSRHTPQVDNIVFWPSDEKVENQNREVIANLELDSLIPTLIVNGGTGTPLFNSTDCLVSEKADSRYERPSILSITAIPLANPANPTTVCTTAYDGGLYASTQALYLSEYEYLRDGQAFTRVHKFAVDGATVNYRASGRVAGSLGWNSAAFRMSEQDDLLRIITSEWTPDGPQHALTVLQDTNGSLSQVARIPNESQPTPIGKPNEDIYGVRFLGDRAYIVTFERIDPLYVVDLSNPTQPQIRGALEIEGVSEYLQLLDANTLLGIGQVENRLQVSLFDVSNPEQPALSSRFLAGGTGSNTPAFYDYKAIAWLDDPSGTSTRLAFPASLRDEWRLTAQGVQLLTLDLNTRQIIDDGFVTALTDNHRYYGLERALIDRDLIHYSNGTTVWTARWDSPSVVNGPQAFPEETATDDEAKPSDGTEN